MKHNNYLAIFFSCLLSAGCTQSGSDSSSISTIIGDISSIVPAPTNIAEKQIQEIKTSLNQAAEYQLTAEDNDLLVSESLIGDRSELKSWVK